MIAEHKFKMVTTRSKATDPSLPTEETDPLIKRLMDLESLKSYSLYQLSEGVSERERNYFETESEEFNYIGDEMQFGESESGGSQEVVLE